MTPEQIRKLALHSFTLGDNEEAWVLLLVTLKTLVPKSEAYSLRGEVWRARVALQNEAQAGARTALQVEAHVTNQPDEMPETFPMVSSPTPPTPTPQLPPQANGGLFPNGPLIGAGLPGQSLGPRSIGLSFNAGRGFDGTPGHRRCPC
jgi:hypothetical protein